MSKVCFCADYANIPHSAGAGTHTEQSIDSCMTSYMTGASVDTVVPEAGVCMNAPSQLFAAFTHNSANVKEHVVRQENWVIALRGAGDVIKS